MSPKIVDHQKRKLEILNAACELFVKNGYHQTTLSSIAKAAGIGQGTLYYYFPTKDEIFWGVYELLISQMEKKIESRLNKITSPQQQLSEMLKILFFNFPEVGIAEDTLSPLRETIISFSQTLLEFWLHAERTGNRDKFYQRFYRHQNLILQKLTAILKELELNLPPNLTPELFANLLLALRDGISFQLRIGTLKKDRETLETIYSLVYSSLKDFLN